MESLARKRYQALKRIECLEWDLEDWDEDSDTAAKLLAAVQKFGHYIEVNQNAIPNYGDRYRHGETISTSFAESAVNQVASKRMVELQQNALDKARGTLTSSSTHSCTQRRPAKHVSQLVSRFGAKHRDSDVRSVASRFALVSLTWPHTV